MHMYAYVYIYTPPFLMYLFNHHGNPRNCKNCGNLGKQERALRDKLVGFTRYFLFEAAYENWLLHGGFTCDHDVTNHQNPHRWNTNLIHWIKILVNHLIRCE